MLLKACISIQRRVLHRRCFTTFRPAIQQVPDTYGFQKSVRLSSHPYATTLHVLHRTLFITPTVFNGKILSFKLSDIGEGISEVVVKEWFVNVGDKVSQFDPICEVQSDKASVTITSRYDGVVRKIHYEVEDVAKVGQPLIDIQTTTGTDSTTELFDQVLDEDANQKRAETSENLQLTKEKFMTTPAVRRLAAENNVQLAEVKPSGKDGRILKEDVLAYLENRNRPDKVPCENKESIKQSQIVKEIPSAPSVVNVSIEEADRTEVIKGIKKAMVKTMTEALKIPHFGLSDDVDLSSLVLLRSTLQKKAAERNIKLSFVPFFVKAASLALLQYPVINSTVDTNCETITYRSTHNIGVAVDTKHGLVVPNVKNVQKLTLMEIAAEVNRLQVAALAGQVASADLKDGTFTLSNIGSIGGTFGIPVILPPAVAIGAIGKINVTPKFDDQGSLKKAHIMTVVWSADHRVVDGATMCRFSNLWKSYLEDPCTMLLDMK